MDGCVFCQIANRVIPAEIIHDNDLTTVILDIKPANPGHALVISKSHYPDFMSTPIDVRKEIFNVAHNVAKAVMAASGAPAFNLIVNSGKEAGQVVHHMHVHVIPRFAGDGHQQWHGKPYAEGEAAKMAEKVRKEMKNNT